MKNESAPGIHMHPPAVRVKVPAVTVESPEVTVHADVDTSSMTAVVQTLAQSVDRMGVTLAEGMRAHDARLVAVNEQISKVLAQQTRILQALEKREAPAPVVNMPSRPRDYSVSLEKEDGTVLEMRIEADRPH